LKPYVGAGQPQLVSPPRRGHPPGTARQHQPSDVQDLGGPFGGVKSGK
jgi:hypothetical protein